MPRQITVLVVISVIVNIIVAAGFVWLAVGNSAHNTAVNTAEHTSQIAACGTSNRTRARTGHIIDGIIALLPAGKPAAVARLKRNVAANYRQQDCAAMYSVTPSTKP